MSVLGEAGGFEVEVMGNGEVVARHRQQAPWGMPPSQARALAAMLVTAAEEAERGKAAPRDTDIRDIAMPAQSGYRPQHAPDPMAIKPPSEGSAVQERGGAE